MTYKGIEMGKYPICDTDIWVYAVLGNLDELLIEKYGKIIVADVVEKEILKFGNPGIAQKVAPIFRKYKKEKRIIVIQHSDIEKRERRFLEKQLVECDECFKTGLSDDPHEEHKGEIVSAIYAEYFEVPFLKSNDNAFREGGIGKIKFPNLIVKDLQSMLEDLVADKKKRQEYNQLIHKNQLLLDKEKRMHREKTVQEQRKELPLTEEQIIGWLNEWKERDH